MEIYYKIINHNMKQFNYQYKLGLNLLDKDFDPDRNNICSQGGLYFTTKKYLYRQMYRGSKLCIIELPSDARVVDSIWKENHIVEQHNYRTDKLIIKKIYSLFNENDIKEIIEIEPELVYMIYDRKFMFTQLYESIDIIINIKSKICYDCNWAIKLTDELIKKNNLYVIETLSKQHKLINTELINTELGKISCFDLCMFVCIEYNLSDMCQIIVDKFGCKLSNIPFYLNNNIEFFKEIGVSFCLLAHLCKRLDIIDILRNSSMFKYNWIHPYFNTSLNFGKFVHNNNQIVQTLPSYYVDIIMNYITGEDKCSICSEKYININSTPILLNCGDMVCVECYKRLEYKTSKNETSKNETSKNETSKNETSKNETSKNETSKNISMYKKNIIITQIKTNNCPKCVKPFTTCLLNETKSINVHCIICEDYIKHVKNNIFIENL
jgi:hypothetical protein